ncbi:MAG: hypothetical protein ACFFEO_04055 [Candidatus Thorarchaeota archaeon]
MKELRYSLRIGFIGEKGLIKEIFLENLNKSFVEFDFSRENYVFEIVFKQIPLKIKTFLAENLENLLYKVNKIKKLDILIITVNLHEAESLNNINRKIMEEFNSQFNFNGLTVLVGMDLEQIFNKSPSGKYKISRFHLEKITKELNLIYCYEIFNKDKDIDEIYDKLLNDFLIRFQYSNRELFEKVKDYGKKLIS